MDKQDAIRSAKAAILETFAEEGPLNVALEELKFDYEGKAWWITIGFERDPARFTAAPSDGALAGLTLRSFVDRRTYKVVRIDDATGKVLSIDIRTVEPLDAW